MIKEARNKELTREDVYTEYFSRKIDKNEVNITKEVEERISEVKEYFKGKTELEIMIKGNIHFDRNFQKMFTFLNKTYDIKEGNIQGLESALIDLDEFKAFATNGNPVNYFSSIENEYVNYTRVLNAKILMELR